MDRVEFIELLGRNGVPYIDYPSKDLDREMAVVRAAAADAEQR